MLEDIVDFTFDTSTSSPNVLYALNTKGEVYVFELNTNHQTCKTLGKVLVKDSSRTSKILSWGSSLLAVTNSDDSAVTLMELQPDAKDFVAANIKTAEYQLPQCEEGRPEKTLLQSQDAFLVVNTCKGLLTIQNTIAKPIDANAPWNWQKYIPQVVFLIALGGTGWW
jgi:regulatory protein YycI of two-component signal transduction system YycFG